MHNCGYLELLSSPPLPQKNGEMSVAYFMVLSWYLLGGHKATTRNWFPSQDSNHGFHKIEVEVQIKIKNVTKLYKTDWMYNIWDLYNSEKSELDNKWNSNLPIANP